MAYDNTNTGALFKAKERATDKHPEYAGTINVGGTEYWLSGWVREAKNGGQKFFSLAVKPKDGKPAAKTTGNIHDMEDDIPF